jgi:hypothetical protein
MRMLAIALVSFLYSIRLNIGKLLSRFQPMLPAATKQPLLPRNETYIASSSTHRINKVYYPWFAVFTQPLRKIILFIELPYSSNLFVCR